jgi:replicative DNA helicase
MTVNLEKLAIKRLLESQSTDLYNRLVYKFFSNTNIILFRRIQKFYEEHMRIPSKQEFYELQNSEVVKEYLQLQVYADQAEEVHISDNFIAERLQDYYIREETINWLDKFIDQLENLERTEIIDGLQQHLLDLHAYLPEGEELFDVASLESFLEEEKFVLYSSGLSSPYDATNGGFGLQELIMFGGRRGSGKSIITLNAARHQFEENNNSILFMSIEMRYIEVYYRLMSMMSRVPFMRFIRNELTEQDKLLIAKTKLDTFYEKTDESVQLYDSLLRNKNVRDFDQSLRLGKVPFKNKRFHIVDDVNLSLAKIDHYLNMMTKKHNVKMCVIDYMNIVKVEDRMDWKSQISIADQLKTLSRKYEVMMVSPYQIDASGEARFAKGVLDSADRSFRFTPADLDENPNILPFEITKIRNGKSMKFDVHMDWDCLRVVPESSSVTPGRIMNKYGDDSKEQRSDLG